MFTDSEGMPHSNSTIEVTPFRVMRSRENSAVETYLALIRHMLTVLSSANHISWWGTVQKDGVGQWKIMGCVMLQFWFLGLQNGVDTSTIVHPIPCICVYSFACPERSAVCFKNRGLIFKCRVSPIYSVGKPIHLPKLQFLMSMVFLVSVTPIDQGQVQLVWDRKASLSHYLWLSTTGRWNDLGPWHWHTTHHFLLQSCIGMFAKSSRGSNWSIRSVSDEPAEWTRHV